MRCGVCDVELGGVYLGRLNPSAHMLKCERCKAEHIINDGEAFELGFIGECGNYGCDEDHKCPDCLAFEADDLYEAWKERQYE